MYQNVPLEIHITKKNRIPLGRIQLKVLVENTMYGESKEQTVILCSPEKKETQFSHMLRMDNCGCVRVTVVHVKCYDLLGLFCRMKPGSAQQEILVYPAQLQLHTQFVRRPETILAGELYDQNRKGQDVSEVSALRGYEEGDSLGSIHWKLSSKLDDLVVREFGYPSNYNILILYDLMLFFGEKEISSQRNDAVLAFTSALSRSMIERNLEHNVGSAADGEMLLVFLILSGLLLFLKDLSYSPGCLMAAFGTGSIVIVLYGLTERSEKAAGNLRMVLHISWIIVFLVTITMTIQGFLYIADCFLGMWNSRFRTEAALFAIGGNVGMGSVILWGLFAEAVVSFLFAQIKKNNIFGILLLLIPAASCGLVLGSSSMWLAVLLSLTGFLVFLLYTPLYNFFKKKISYRTF